MSFFLTVSTQWDYSQPVLIAKVNNIARFHLFGFPHVGPFSPFVSPCWAVSLSVSWALAGCFLRGPLATSGSPLGSLSLGSRSASEPRALPWVPVPRLSPSELTSPEGCYVSYSGPSQLEASVPAVRWASHPTATFFVLAFVLGPCKHFW